jgi:hypothetical protein
LARRTCTQWSTLWPHTVSTPEVYVCHPVSASTQIESGPVEDMYAAMVVVSPLAELDTVV